MNLNFNKLVAISLALAVIHKVVDVIFAKSPGGGGRGGGGGGGRRA